MPSVWIVSGFHDLSAVSLILLAYSAHTHLSHPTPFTKALQIGEFRIMFSLYFDSADI